MHPFSGHAPDRSAARAKKGCAGWKGVRRSLDSRAMSSSPYADRVARVPVRTEELALRAGRTKLWVYGPDDAAHRVVFLHGLRGDHHGLEPIVAHLEGVRVVVPDLPGFGASPPLPSDRHDVAGYAAWTRDLLTALAPDGDAVLAGHSFGSI